MTLFPLGLFTIKKSNNGYYFGWGTYTHPSTSENGLTVRDLTMFLYKWTYSFFVGKNSDGENETPPSRS